MPSNIFYLLQVISPHFVNAQTDDLNVMTYISYFRDARPKEGMFAPTKGKLFPTQGAVAYGFGSPEKDMSTDQVQKRASVVVSIYKRKYYNLI